MRIQSPAPSPVRTMIAVGGAIPRAQGHAMMITATKTNNADVRGLWRPYPARVDRQVEKPRTNQYAAAAAAAAITAGTKTAAARSAILWIGARGTCASSTSWRIGDRAVSFPIFGARTLM